MIFEDVKNQTIQLKTSPEGGSLSFYAISLNKIIALFSLLKNLISKGDTAEDIDFDDYFPVDFFPSKDIYIDYFFIEFKKNVQVKIHLELSWQNAQLEVIPDILTLENFVVGINVYGTTVSVFLNSSIEFEKYPFEVQVELPAMLVEAKLKHIDIDLSNVHLSPNEFLEKHNIPPYFFKKVNKDNPFKLIDFRILARPLINRLVFQVDLENIPLGPIYSDLSLELIYFDQGFSGFLRTNYKIVLEEHKVINILLSAAYNGAGSGWHLEGGLVVSEVTIGDFIRYVSNEFNIENVNLGFANNLIIDFIYLTVDTQTGQFTFTIEFENKDPKATITLHLELTKIQEEANSDLEPEAVNEEKETYEITLSGELAIVKEGDKRNFNLIFSKTKEDTLLLASYQKPGGEKVSLSDLLKDVMPGVTIPGLEMGLKNALLVLDKKAGGVNKYLFTADIDFGVDLSSLGQLPIVGKLFAAADPLKLAFQPILAHRGNKDEKQQNEEIDDAPNGGTQNDKEIFLEEEIQKITALIPSGGPALPDRSISEPFALITTISWGSFKKVINLGIPANQVDDNLQAGSELPKVSEGDESEEHTEKLDKSFGALNISRLNLKYDKDKDGGAIIVQLDADLRLGPIEVGLAGLGASYALKGKKLSATLDGMAISYKKPPIEISGAFMKLQFEGREPDYVGRIKIQLKTFGLVALGAFSEIKIKTDEGKIKTQPSFYLYVAINYPLGGPVYFFVEGLSFGFGYNRLLTVPDVSEIGEFPFVAEVTGKNEPLKTDAPLASENEDSNSMIESLRDEFEMLGKYVTPKKDQYFLAVGLKFNSFKIVHCFGLLIVNFGETLDFTLIGTGNVTYPLVKLSDDQPILAQLKIDIKATYKPAEGFIGIDGFLDAKESFVLSKDIHLEGRLAFHSWLSGPNAGDFVLSLGGYHKDFQIPDHYPQREMMRRLSFNWVYSKFLTIKGGIYFAITPKAMMFGAGLEGIFKLETKWLEVNANLNSGVDVLIFWQPFQYQGDAYIEVDAAIVIKAKVKNFHAGLSASARLDFWGPPFAGEAHIKAKVVGFKVNFKIDIGNQAKPVPEKISWEQFKESFLPDDPANKALTVTVANGLISTIKENGEERWIVNPKTLRIDVSSLVPFSENEDETTAIIESVKGPSLQVNGSSGGLGVKEIETSALLKSSLMVTIKMEDENENKNLIGDLFTSSTTNKKFPRSLWTDKVTIGPVPNINGEQLIDLKGGLVITAKKPLTANNSFPVPVENISFDISLKKLKEPQNVHLKYQNNRELFSEINLDSSNENRNNLLRELGFDNPEKEFHVNSETLASSLARKAHVVTIE